ncbi:MAG: DUF5675 family protein [Bacteroidota bacterium]
MLKFFRKLWQWLLGASEEEEKPQEETTTPEIEQPPKEEKPADKASGISLKRYSYGKFDSLGKFYIGGEMMAYTIEVPKANCIPEGSYTLSLHKEGGMHATYWYKFGDMHKGMIKLEGRENIDSPFLRIGNRASDALGGILFGSQVQKEENTEAVREIWYSEKAYLKVYNKIVELIEKGESVSLEISSE